MTQFQKCSVMEPMEWIALIGGVLSLLGVGVDLWQTNKANKKQEEHDLAMAALNHKYREEEAISSFEREANFNQYSADYNKMLEANISPSLMYGGIQPSAPSVSSVGSSQGAGNVGRKMNVSDFLGKLDPAEYSSQMIDRMNAKTMRERTDMQNKVDSQAILESISRTMENQRNTAFKKSLEATVMQQEQQALKNLQTTGEQMAFDLQYSRDVRDIRLEKEQLQNVEIRKNIDLTVEKIKNQPYERARLSAEVKELEALTTQAKTNAAYIGENMRNSQLDRVMREFGLNGRTFNPMMRNADLFNLPFKTQMKGAQLALQELGFSEFEATNAVIYYLAENKKDVTPSLVNGFSRWLASLK